MNNIAIIVKYNNLDDEVIYEGKPSFQIVEEKVKEIGLPYYIFSSIDNKNFIKFDGTVNSLLKQIDFNLKSFNNILFFTSDMPLYDINLVKKMLKEHEENLADFTLSENYPEGFSPFVLNRASFKKLLLISTGNNSIYSYNSIKSLIELDINSYDVEIISPDIDMRFIRETFSTKNKRGYILTKSLLEKNVTSSNLLDKIRENPNLLRPLPIYITIELSSYCNQKCIFCPYSKIKKDKLFSHNLEKLINEISIWTEECFVEFSGIGEPFLYPEFDKVIKIIMEKTNINFIIETNGTLIEKYIEKLREIKNLTLIISINADNKQDYKNIHGSDDFDIVETNIERAIKNNINTYLQFVRCKDTEQYLEGFIKRWDFIKDKIILKKYNDFCFMEDKKVVDLAPLNRFPCWKLQRNLYISSDYYLSPCYQDIKNSIGIDLSKKTIQEAWEELNNLYKKHWENSYPDICKNCDEWYIFDM